MNTQLLSIKAKKFGVRLAAFRQKKGLSTEILSQWTGISIDKLNEIEQGESTITLPEIELIALKLGFSVETLLTGNIQNQPVSKPDEVITRQFTSLRDRMIALVLRKTRTEQNLTLEAVSVKCGLEQEQLEQYESGNEPFPLPILECLCTEYQIPIFSLITQKAASSTNSIDEDRSIIKSNDTLPEELSQFVNNPANLPYLELARKLSEMDASKLRGIAEGLLEITY